MRTLLLTSALVALSAGAANAQSLQGFSAGVDYYGLEATSSFPDVKPTDIVINEQHDETSQPVGFSLGYTHAVGDFYLGGRISFADADQSGEIDFIEGQHTEYTVNSLSTVELRAGYGFDTPFGEVVPYGFIGVISREVDVRQTCVAAYGIFPDRCNPSGGASGYSRTGSIDDSTFLFGAGVEWAVNPWASVDLSYGQATFDETTVSLGVDGRTPGQPLSTIIGEQEYSYIRLGVRVRFDAFRFF